MLNTVAKTHLMAARYHFRKFMAELIRTARQGVKYYLIYPRIARNVAREKYREEILHEAVQISREEKKDSPVVIEYRRGGEDRNSTTVQGW